MDVLSFQAKDCRGILLNLVLANCPRNSYEFILYSGHAVNSLATLHGRAYPFSSTLLQGMFILFMLEGWKESWTEFVMER